MVKSDSNLTIFKCVFGEMDVAEAKEGIGYVSMTFHQLFHFKVGILKVNGSRQFSMVIENKSDVDVVVKDIYLEIKKGARYEKQPLPASAFDNTKTMTIPPA